MFDANQFKRSVKDWIRQHPEGSLSDFQDFCDEQIPPAQFTNYQWLVDQTMDWYKHILTHRELSRKYDEGEEDSAIA